MGFRVQGSGFRFQGSGFGVQGLGFVGLVVGMLVLGQVLHGPLTARAWPWKAVYPLYFGFEGMRREPLAKKGLLLRVLVVLNPKPYTLNPKPAILKPL